MRPRLFLLAPRVVFRAQVAQVDFSYPIAEVTYDNVTVGSSEQVIYGQTVVFGTAAGLDDLGRQRVRKPPTSDTFYFGRSSRGTHDGEVSLRDDAWIEVWDDYRIWPRIPAMPVVDGQDLTTYKDHDIAVGLYTTTPPPVANIGPGYAGTIDAQTGRITVEFDASHSWAVADGATITAYQWFVEDGTIVSGTDADPQITATFPPGFRWVALTVTDSGGLTHTARCPVYARDPEDDDSIEAFEITRHRITPQGQELSLRILEDIPAATYPDGTLVLLWDDDAVTPGRGHMWFCGWHHTDPAQISAQRLGIQRDVVLTCLDVAGKLDTLPGFPQVLYADSLRDPQTHPQITWEYMVNPTVRKYIHYLLHWHSTALDLADLRFRGSTAGDGYPFLVLESGGASLYDQVASRAQALTPDHMLTCTRRGELAVWPDPMLLDVLDRSEVHQGTILESHWSDIRYTHQRPPRVYWLRAGAVVAQATPTYRDDGSLNIPTVFCVTPGEAPGTGEIAQEENERLTLSQEALNRTIGHKYARLNAPEGLFSVTLAGSDDFGLEPANLEWVWLEFEHGAQRGLHLETVAGLITVPQERGLVHAIDIRYQHSRTGLLRTITVEWEREVSGTPAVTVIPPVAEPADTYDPFPYVPPVQPPVITLLGDNPLYVGVSQPFADPGATAWGEVDGDLTSQIVVGGDVVDPSTPGTYALTYDVTDSAGNHAVQRIRWVMVYADTAPVEMIATYAPGSPNVDYDAGTDTLTLTLVEPLKYFDYFVFAFVGVGNPDDVLLLSANPNNPVMERFVPTHGNTTYSGFVGHRQLSGTGIGAAEIEFTDLGGPNDWIIFQLRDSKGWFVTNAVNKATLSVPAKYNITDPEYALFPCRRADGTALLTINLKTSPLAPLERPDWWAAVIGTVEASECSQAQDLSLDNATPLRGDNIGAWAWAIGVMGEDGIMRLPDGPWQAETAVSGEDDPDDKFVTGRFHMYGIGGPLIEPPPVSWWLGDGSITPTAVVGAYDAYRANGLAASCVNWANPANNLEIGVPPEWDNAWLFNGSTGQRYLKTGLIPDSNWSMVVAYSFANVTLTRYLAGMTNDTSEEFIVGHNPTQSKSRVWANGSKLLIPNSWPGSIDSGVMSIAGQQAYYNGQPVGTPMTPWTTPPLYEIYIGCRNWQDSPGVYASARITHVAIYNTTLSDEQMLAIVNAIQAELNA